jgi:hypothetical protein
MELAANRHRCHKPPKNEWILHYQTGIVPNRWRTNDWFMRQAAQGELLTLYSLAQRRQELL